MMTQEEIWFKLYSNQIQNAINHAVSPWSIGMIKQKLINFPQLEDVSIPHWKIMPILGKSPEPIFWYRLSRGIFNVNMRLRSEDQLAYLEERDLFHDYFGHTPMLWHKEYTDFVIGLGIFAQHMKHNPAALKAVSNFYWVFPEFGLMREGDTLKVLGAGILSSVDELNHVMVDSVGPNPQIIEFKTLNHFDAIAEMKEYVTDGFQTQYYMLQSWDQLKRILKYLWTRYE